MTLTIAETEKELAAAITIEQEIAAELSEVERRLSEMRITSGDRALTARKAGDKKQITAINDELAKLNSEHEILSKTHAAAREAIREARHAINMARGRDLRAQAAALTAQADVSQKITDALLKKLRDHEKIHYQPVAMVDESGAMIPGSFATSATMKIRIDAESLVRQAAVTESQVCRIEPDAPTTGRKSGAIYPDARGNYPTT
jgi:hypothetical protein